MLNVYLTVDTEIWPENWDLSQKNFQKYYNQYILGLTNKGEYGLPFQLRILKEHGLKAVFFVEPLFAHHYGLSPLRDIVCMVQDAGQQVELHLHTEWVGRTKRPIPPGRFQLNLKDYSVEEQYALIREGADNLLQAGATSVSAFRAGNFGANRDTFEALSRNEIFVDSSYNLASALGPCINETIFHPTMVGNVAEYPVTVFEDGFKRHRHLQIGANSYQEMSRTLKQAYNMEWSDATLFWHSGELLTRSKNHHDPIAIHRFTKLCDFLAKHNDMFITNQFEQSRNINHPKQTAHNLKATTLDTGIRYSEQIVRRLWGS